MIKSKKKGYIIVELFIKIIIELFQLFSFIIFTSIPCYNPIQILIEHIIRS